MGERLSGLGKAARPLLVVALLSLGALAVPLGAVHATGLVISPSDSSGCTSLGGNWDSTSYTCTFTSAVPFALSAQSLTVEAGATLLLNYPSQINTGSSLMLDSGAVLHLSTTATLSNFGTVTNEAGGTIEIACSANPCFANEVGGVLTNYGTISVEAYSGVGIYNLGTYPTFAVMKNYGTITDTADVPNGQDIRNTGYFYNEASGVVNLYSYGDGAIALSTYELLNNSGTITIGNAGPSSQGVLVENGFENYGTLNVDNHGPGSYGIVITQYGTLTAKSGSKTVIGSGASGSYGISNTAGQYGIGTVVVNTGATMNVQNGAAGSEGIYNVYGVSNGLDYYANFTNSGTMSVSNGAYTTGIYNTANFENNGTLAVSPTSSPATGVYTSGDFNNSGTVTVSNSGLRGVGMNVGGGVLVNVGSLTVSNSGAKSTGINMSGGAILADSGPMTVSNRGDNSTGVQVGVSLVHPAILELDTGAVVSVSNTGATSVGIDIQTRGIVKAGGTMYLTYADGIAAALEVDRLLLNAGTILSCPTLQAYVLDGSGTLIGFSPTVGTFCPAPTGSGSAYSVDVSVFSPGGSPVDDAVVSLNGDTGLTGLGDSVDFGLATSGTYTIAVTAPGFPDYTASVTVSSYTTDLSITLGSSSRSSSGSSSGAPFTSAGAGEATSGGLTSASASFTNGGATPQTVDVWSVWYNQAGQVVNIGEQLNVQFAPGQTITFAGTYALPGTYTVKMFVTTADGTGVSGSYSTSITVP